MKQFMTLCHQHHWLNEEVSKIYKDNQKQWHHTHKSETCHAHALYFELNKIYSSLTPWLWWPLVGNEEAQMAHSSCISKSDSWTDTWPAVFANLEPPTKA